MSQTVKPEAQPQNNPNSSHESELPKMSQKPETPPQAPPPNSPPRESMIKIAVEFLQNPRVRNTPLSRQKEFLYKKGLTPEEVEFAVRRAGVPVNSVPFEQSTPLAMSPSKGQLMMYRPSIWTRINRMGSAIIILGIAIYGLHKFYKLYIEPWLYGYQKREDRLMQVEEQLLEVSRSLSQLRKSVSAIEESLGVQKNQLLGDFSNPNVNSDFFFNPAAVMEMRADIATVKSLLLNRHQFPDAPRISPSIPAWQLAAKSDETANKLEQAVTNDQLEQPVTNDRNENEAEEDITKQSKIANGDNTLAENKEEESAMLSDSEYDTSHEVQCEVLQENEVVQKGDSVEEETKDQKRKFHSDENEEHGATDRSNIVMNGSVVDETSAEKVEENFEKAVNSNSTSECTSPVLT